MLILTAHIQQSK